MNIYKVKVVTTTVDGSFTWRHFIAAASFHVAFARAAKRYKSVPSRKVQITAVPLLIGAGPELVRKYQNMNWTARGAPPSLL